MQALSRLSGAAMYQSLQLTVEKIARWLAWAGGAVLLFLTLLTCISIAGRAFVSLNIGLGPIRGIYDITEIGMAAAIFAFLPWAQLKEAHARVDLFQWAIPDGMNGVLDLVFNLAMTFVAAVGTWRLYLGMLDKQSYGETTLIAQIPVWIGYAGGLVGAVGFVIVAAFCVLRSGRRLMGYPA